jgi:hypothetical protein
MKGGYWGSWKITYRQGNRHEVDMSTCEEEIKEKLVD